MPLANGSVVGRYTIVGWLGSGGMGDVYRAHDSRLQRDVALKLLPERFSSNPERLGRFEQEARAAGQLNHSNLLTVFDVSSHEGAPFIVSELLEGESLRTVLDRGPLAPARAVAYARQIAEGLAAAHQRGIVHRDIKPENLMVTRDGRIKVLDFGVAKLTRGGAEEPTMPSALTDTTPGTIVGTLAYMSPEQVCGDAVDARSDIFSIGAVFHEMLAGRPPFTRATTAATAAAILKDDPLPPLPSTIPAPLTAIVARCLAKSRDARFQSARDLGFGLEHLTDATTTRTRTASPRWRRVAAVSAAAAVALGVVAVTMTMWRRPRTIEARIADARFVRLTDWPKLEGQGEISPDGRFVAFLSDRDGQVDVWLTQVGTGRFRNLTGGAALLRPPSAVLRILGFSGDGSEIWSDAGLMPMMGGTPRAFLPRGTIGAAWSPDGARLAFFGVSNGDPLYVADRTAADARQIFLTKQAGVHTHNPVWSTNGEWIYFVHGVSAGTTFEMDVWRVRPSGDAPEQLTQLKSAITTLAPIDDRTLLFVAQGADQSGPWLWSLDIPTRRTRRLLAGVDQYRSVSASRDGRRVVVSLASPTTTLSQVSLTDGVAEESDIQPYPVAGAARGPRFGRTSLFYVSGSPSHEGLWKLESGLPKEVWSGADAAVLGQPAVSPDEGLVALVLARADGPQLSVMSTSGTEVRGLARSLVPRGTLDWSPDGAWVVVGGSDGGTPGLYKVPVSGGAAVRLANGEAVNPIWSPDGRQILYNGPIVAGSSALLAIQPDGTPLSIPSVRVRPGGQRFFPGGDGVLYQAGPGDFHILDLSTGGIRQLTRFPSKTEAIWGRTFDISPDGSRVVFEQRTENSDVVLIELPD